MRFVKVFVAVCAMGVGGCGGTTMMNSSPDMAMKPVVPPGLTLEGSMGMTPGDIACVGNPKDPAAPDAETVVTGVIKDFQDDNKVVGAVIKLYATVEDVMANKPMVTSAPSDADGNFTYTVPKGYYRIIRANEGGKAVSSGNMVKTIPTYEFNVVYSDKSPTAVKTSTKDLIPGLVSVTQMDGFGVLAGGARDCNNKHVQGAIVDVAATGYKSDGQIFYFADVPGAGTVPVRNQKWTGDNGVFAALNVPPGYGIVTIKGALKMGDPLTVISQYKIPVIADAVTIVEAQAGPTMAK